MKTLFQKEIHHNILTRIELLAPDARRNWGKMEVAQMLAHCTVVLETASGIHMPPRRFAGRIIGRFFRHHYTSPLPLKPNRPTDPSFVITNHRFFEHEKKRLVHAINHFVRRGAVGVTQNPHPFFGKFTGEEWASGMYKHLDHHLRQFNG